MNKRVAILGGGVAGMSAAHELIERDFEVVVYERKSIPGGKARSVPVAGSGENGRRDLPGEHGFRFFPRFYRHLPDTMRRIPFPGNRNGVFDNLVEATRVEYPRIGQPPIILVAHMPRGFDDWQTLLRSATHTHLGLAPGELQFFGERIWQVMTSCEDRRLDEYEKLGWWDFIGAESRSDEYERFLATGMTRSLNAAKARLASTKTIGDIYVQLLFDMLAPGASMDRLLCGPTNDVWIEPWLTHLRAKGVEYHLDSSFEELHCQDGRITGATIGHDGRTVEIQADYYIAAVPLEVMARKLNNQILEADPTLAGIKEIHRNVQWMNGIQFYLREDVPLVRGHELYVDTPWALTSVSQGQFWPRYPMAGFGDGTVQSVLSVDISEWEVPGSQTYTSGKIAKDCSREEIANETWFQLKESLNIDGASVIADEMLHPEFPWFLDLDIGPARAAAVERERNAEPLLVNYINSWDRRPNAHTRIPNLFLAADYVRTFTDLATMEGANEAARRAVNCILDRSGSRARGCELWKLHEPDLLGPWRRSDQERYDRGLPWNGQLSPGGWLPFHLP